MFTYLLYIYIYITIKGILGGLATPTRCGGIVNLDQIQTSPDVQRLVQIASSMAH